MSLESLSMWQQESRGTNGLVHISSTPQWLAAPLGQDPQHIQQEMLSQGIPMTRAKVQMALGRHHGVFQELRENTQGRTTPSLWSSTA